MAKKYRWRILRNLLAVGFLLVLMWRNAGYPLPTLEMELHRWERQTLREESEIVWSIDQTGYNGPKILVGVSRSGIGVQNRYTVRSSWPRHRDRATLITLIDQVRYWEGTDRNFPGTVLLAIDPPVGAVSARLTLTLSLENPEWRETYVMEGERQGEVFYFLLRKKHYLSGTTVQEEDAMMGFQATQMGEEALNCYPWHLEFFDGEGNLLEEQVNAPSEGENPENF